MNRSELVLACEQTDAMLKILARATSDTDTVMYRALELLAHLIEVERHTAKKYFEAKDEDRIVEDI